MKKFQIFVVFALLAAMVASPSAASAQVFTSYVTGTQVMNLGAADASVIMTYYHVDDGSASAGAQVDQVSDTILTNSSKTYFPATSPFNGSMVISASEPLGAVVNVQNSTATASATYVGASTGATTISLPLLMKNNGAVPYYTWFSVQNAGSVDANVSVNYSDCAAPITAVVKPNASKHFSQAAEACHTSKVFAATITSDQPVVVVVLQENTAKMLAYTGFTPAGTSTNPVLPLINTNNSGIATGVQIQNAGDTDSEVTLSYMPSLAGTACTETKTIPAKSSLTYALAAFVQPTTGSTCIPGERFIGSATVTTNSASMPLVAIVNQSKTAYAGAYGGFNPLNGTPKLIMPLLSDRQGVNNYNSGFSVMNVGGGTTFVKCAFTSTAYTVSGELEVGEALTPNLSGAIAVNYVGSGTCIAYTDATYATVDTAARIVAVVNRTGRTTADRFGVYEGINVQP